MQPDTRSLLAVAAELRAAGRTWEAVAQCVGRQPSTCRKWPSRYRSDWEPLVREVRARGVPASLPDELPPLAERRACERPAAPSVPLDPPPPRPRLPHPHRARLAAVGEGRRHAAAPAAYRTTRPDVRPSRSTAFVSVVSFNAGILASALVIAVARFGAPPAAPVVPDSTDRREPRLVHVGEWAENPDAAHSGHRHKSATAAAGAPTLTSRADPTEMVRDAEVPREPPPAPRRTGTRPPVPDPDPDRLSDEDLLSRFRRGQREVFGTLVRRYQRELYGYLRRYLGDPHLADDVFQTTFVQVFSKAAQYEPGRPVRPWLYAIATNQAIDALRRAGRHPAVSLEQAETEAEGERRGLVDLLEAREADPFDNVDAAETRALVRACVDRLPDFLKQVLLMAYYQGLKYQEIADALDIPLGTVKSRLHAALVKLHEAWDERVPGPDSRVGSTGD